ncbi:hypothetical protein PIB30_066992 [Stylosanthes scabra]|uniref:Aminotransferase-like plant mobile domain-containing protein n=1 Tax=Stylosanthes scabra TaxID=79078 RepID=A0ABU6SNR4_9FABA|nr:hypothetical protein [Stylosanthes scabra]
MTHSSESLSDDQSMACFGCKSGKNDRSKSYIKIAWARETRDKIRLHTQEDVRRYVRVHICCLLWSLIFPEKPTTYVYGMFVQLLQDLDSIRGYSCGSVWERMPWIAPILRHELGPPHVPLANRWNYWPRRYNYRLKPVREFRKEIDDITFFVSPCPHKKHPQQQLQSLFQTELTTQWTTRETGSGDNTETSAACLLRQQQALCQTVYIPQISAPVSDTRRCALSPKMSFYALA